MNPLGPMEGNKILMTRSAVFAVLKDRVHAEVGVDVLMNVGFRPEDISVMLADKPGPGAQPPGLLAPLGAVSVPGYEYLVREGRTLLSVYCANAEWVTRAKQALARVGAEKVESTRDSVERSPAACGLRTRHGGA